MGSFRENPGFPSVMSGHTRCCFGLQVPGVGSLLHWAPHLLSPFFIIFLLLPPPSCISEINNT